MKIAFALALAAVLSACAQFPSAVPDPSPCAQSETSYACQVDRYNKVNQ